MKKLAWLLVILILVFGIGVLLKRTPRPPAPSQFAPSVPQKQLQVQPVLEPAFVTRVIDGDTIEVQLPSGIEKLRYIGIDTPELEGERPIVEFLAQESAAKNAELVAGKKVFLEKDVSSRDRYGRLLRYVYLEDGTFVNLELVRQGFAKVSTYPPDIKYVSQFLNAEQWARQNRLGLWSKSSLPSP